MNLLKIYDVLARQFYGQDSTCRGPSKLTTHITYHSYVENASTIWQKMKFKMLISTVNYKKFTKIQNPK
jgi:hypothetical protein